MNEFLSETDISAVIEMALSDDVSFSSIREQYGLTEEQVKKLMKKNNENRFDVIIAGGGMIGVSMALAISSFGLKIGLVEKVERDENNQPSFDDRSTAISRSSQNMFEAMGIWEKIRQASTPIRTIHVSDKGPYLKHE